MDGNETQPQRSCFYEFSHSFCIPNIYFTKLRIFEIMPSDPDGIPGPPFVDCLGDPKLVGSFTFEVYINIYHYHTLPYITIPV